VGLPENVVTLKEKLNSDAVVITAATIIGGIAILLVIAQSIGWLL
jgi:hypothetical protein